MSDTLTQALDAAGRGWCIFPVTKLGKTPTVRWQSEATTDPQQVRRWLDGTDLNYGISAEPSGLVILDEDTPGELARWAADRGVTIPDTFAVATAQGAHYYFQRGGYDYSNADPFKPDGYNVDVRGHGYVVGPGSVHKTGTVYTVTCDADPVPLPAALHDYLTTPTAAPAVPAPASPLSGDAADAWTRRAVEGALQDLADTAALPEGATDPHGRTWETGALQARARRLVEVSNAAGDAYSRQQARADFEAAAPRGHEARFRHHFDDAEQHVGDRPAQRRAGADEYRLTDGERAALAPETHNTATARPALAPGTAGLSAAPVDPFAPLDWTAVLNGPPPAEDWLIWPLVERGASVSLYSAPKQGKSLVTLELAVKACAGQSVLGRPAVPPLRVLYLDAENTVKDLRKRLHDLGATPEALANLVYLSFPVLAPLDTAKGAGQLHELVLTHRPDLVIIDTISRFIDGPENDADTWLNVYRLALAPLKGQQVAVLRLDHSGKEAKRGERGSSAKNGDVDASWSLTYDEGRQTRTLTRKLTRTGAGPERLVLNVHTGPLRHEPASPLDWSADPIAHLVRKLDELGVPLDHGRDRAARALRDAGHSFRNEQLTEALRMRRSRPTEPVPVDPAATRLGDRFGDRCGTVPTVGTGSQVSAGQHLSPVLGTGPGQVSTAPPVPSPSPYRRGTGGQVRDSKEKSSADAPLCAGCEEPLPASAVSDGHTTHPTCERTNS